MSTQAGGPFRPGPVAGVVGEAACWTSPNAGGRCHPGLHFWQPFRLKIAGVLRLHSHNEPHHMAGSSTQKAFALRQLAALGHLTVKLLQQTQVSSQAPERQVV